MATITASEFSQNEYDLVRSRNAVMSDLHQVISAWRGPFNEKFFYKIRPMLQTARDIEDDIKKNRKAWFG